jgi:molecular chaperone IbpA
MTNTLTLRSLDIPSIHKFGIGFDNIFDDLLNRTAQGQTNYPPYNIVKQSDDSFAIELAVAGFKDGEISITTERNQLTVKGEQAVDLDTQVEYLHRGISARSFARTWTLADHVEVAGARSENGILTISLERKVPEEQKPKSIAITYTK